MATSNSDYDNIVRHCIKNGTLWEDPEFPAVQSSVFYHQTPPFAFQWKRPHVRNFYFMFSSQDLNSFLKSCTFQLVHCIIENDLWYPETTEFLEIQKQNVLTRAFQKCKQYNNYSKFYVKFGSFWYIILFSTIYRVNTQHGILGSSLFSKLFQNL